jgi:type I restriction enzyme S subunit
MDAQQFLAEFGHIANAPGGIERLRELIYQFAVTGRLAPQQTEEGDASLVLERVAQVRQRLIREKRFKRTAKLESETLMAPGIALPESWRWSRLLDLGEINPRNDPEDDAAATFVPMAAVSEKHGQPLGGEVTRWGAISKGYTHFANGDVLIAKITPCFENGKAARVTGLQHGIGAGSTEFHVFRPITEDVNPAYVYLFLRSPLFRVRGQTSMTGTAGQKRLPTDYFALCAMPLPPKGEQASIVSKVDELMALCDQLEKQQQDRRKLQNALRQSTLQALASAESPYELQESWQRLQGNFGRLFSEPGDARSLRDVLFDLALRGLLLPDSRLSSSGAPSSEELGSLPSGWNWKTLTELTEYITSGSRGWKAYMSSSGDSFIRSQDIRQDALVFESPAYVTLPERVEGKRTLVRPGDLLLTITGGNVGRCAIVPALTNKAYVSQHVALIRLQDPSLSEFIHFWMVNAFGGRAFLARYIYGDKPGLNLAQVGSVPIPVPPASALTEVLKSLRRYQQLCDALETQLKAVQEVASKLSSAAVAALTGVAVEKEKEVALKAPQTELIAPLRLGALPDVKDLAPLATLLARNQGEMSARDLWQRFGGEIDAFYAQLKTEAAHGWIEDPSYELGEKEPQGPRTYPEGALVAKMKIKQEA